MQVPQFEDGNFVGPTVLADVKSDMDCYEVFLECLLCICFNIIFIKRLPVIQGVRQSNPLQD